MPSPGVSGPVADFHGGDFIAIRATELVLEQNRQCHPESVTAEQTFGAAVFHATFGREHWCPAQRAPAVSADDPLGDQQSHAEHRQPRSDCGQLTILGHQRLQQHPGRHRHEHANAEPQDCRNPESRNLGGGAGTMHGGKVAMAWAYRSSERGWVTVMLPMGGIA